MKKTIGYGARLAAARRRSKLTQKGAMSALGWDATQQSRISQYENEKREPSLRDFIAMAKLYNTDPAALVFGETHADPMKARVIEAFNAGDDKDRSTLFAIADVVLRRVS